MLVAASAFILAGVLQLTIEGAETQTVSVMLQLPQIVIISIAEVLISITSVSAL
jgi:dipeptide/tripeptide permease